MIADTYYTKSVIFYYSFYRYKIYIRRVLNYKTL